MTLNDGEFLVVELNEVCNDQVKSVLELELNGRDEGLNGVLKDVGVLGTEVVEYVLASFLLS